MSLVFFDLEVAFKCPCGCNKELTLLIQESEGYGWNAFVNDGQKMITHVGQDG